MVEKQFEKVDADILKEVYEQNKQKYQLDLLYASMYFQIAYNYLNLVNTGFNTKLLTFKQTEDRNNLLFPNFNHLSLIQSDKQIIMNNKLLDDFEKVFVKSDDNYSIA
jgi:hypothetical protein